MHVLSRFFLAQDQSTLCKEIRLLNFCRELEPQLSLFSGPSLADPIKLDINPELKNMINSDSASAPVYQPTKPVTAPVKTFEPKAKREKRSYRPLINDTIERIVIMKWPAT